MNDEYLSVLTCSGEPLTLAENGQSLAGKVALVCAGGSGRGRELAIKLATHGAPIIFTASDLDSAESVSEEIRAMGGKAIAICVDISVKSQVEMLVKYASGIFGSLEFLINSEGTIYNVSKLIDSKESDLDKALIKNINTCKSTN